MDYVLLDLLDSLSLYLQELTDVGSCILNIVLCDLNDLCRYVQILGRLSCFFFFFFFLVSRTCVG